jgi:hypothetical protein
MIGKVLSYDPVTYIIRFTVPLYIENAEALPLDVWDRPNPGDEVYIFEDDKSYGTLYVYHKMGIRDKDKHILQTDSLDVVMDESSQKLSVTQKSGATMTVDFSGKSINITFGGADVMIDTKSIHLGNGGNEPAILFNKYEQRMKDLYKALANHKHGTSMGPSTPPIGGEEAKFSSTFPSTLSKDKSNHVDIMK